MAMIKCFVELIPFQIDFNEGTYDFHSPRAELKIKEGT